jgi:hypothetical protein
MQLTKCSSALSSSELPTVITGERVRRRVAGSRWRLATAIPSIAIDMTKGFASNDLWLDSFLQS